jgi:hypothetical protein
VIHDPAFQTKQGRYHSVAVSAISPGQLDHPFHQQRFIIRNVWIAPLRGTGLPNHPTRSTLGNILPI